MVDDYGFSTEAAGNLGGTDSEYQYPPEKWQKEGIICAADEHYATRSEVEVQRRAFEARITALEKRAERLEECDADTVRQVHYLNERIAALECAAIANKPHWLTPPNVNERIAQNPPFAAAMSFSWTWIEK